jgi:hypothetical protein
VKKKEEKKKKKKKKNKNKEKNNNNNTNDNSRHAMHAALEKNDRTIYLFTFCTKQVF